MGSSYNCQKDKLTMCEFQRQYVLYTHTYEAFPWKIFPFEACISPPPPCYKNFLLSLFGIIFWVFSCRFLWMGNLFVFLPFTPLKSFFGLRHITFCCTSAQRPSPSPSPGPGISLLNSDWRCSLGSRIISKIRRTIRLINFLKILVF